jgi:hypothetical protein
MTAAVTSSLLVPHDCAFHAIDLDRYDANALFSQDVDWSAHTAFVPLVIIGETKYVAGTSAREDWPVSGEQSRTESTWLCGAALGKMAAKYAVRGLSGVVPVAADRTNLHNAADPSFALVCRAYRTLAYIVAGPRNVQPTAARSATADPVRAPADTGGRSSEIETKIEKLFASGAACEFEDGTPNPFSAGLLAAIREYGTGAMEIVAYLIFYNKVNRRAASEALRWLGQVKDAPTLAYRRWLLETSLASASPVVRDGALLGLAYLEDRHCVPFLAEAAKREPIAHLRRDMTELLRYLERTNGEPDAQVPQART